MKKLLFVSLFLAAALTASLAGCARIVTLAPPATRSYDLGSFTSVEVGHTRELIQIGHPMNIPISVTLTQADTYQVNITANENIFDSIAVSKDGTALKIIVNRLKIGNPEAILQVQIAAPSLAGIKADGVDMTATVVSSTPVFAAEITDSGQLDITLEAVQATLTASSASQLVAHGTVQAYTAILEESSKFTTAIEAAQATLRVSSASSATVSGDFQVFSAEADESSNLTLNIRSGRTTLSLSSASSANGYLATGPANFTLDESSTLTLDGTGTNAAIDASSASRLELKNFNLESASVVLSESSSGEVKVSAGLDVNLSSGSSLTYHGKPTLGSSRISDSSELKQAS